MRVVVVLILALTGAASARAQEPASAGDNPLAALKADLTRVLADANVPFTVDQDRSITLMMEERLQASESLFGGLMDFRAGPTSGQQAEQLQSAIAWLRNEFLSRVTGYLAEPQLKVWQDHLAASRPAGGPVAEGRAAPPQQTQYVRINNNRFTAEDVQYQGGGGGGFGGGGGGRGGGGAQETEVIARGGAGAWHGTMQSLFKDDALNARNVFADNKPAYQERQINVDIGGPAIPGRLTTNLVVAYSLAQNVDTINATLPDGPFSLGITRPTTNRSVNSRNTFQLADAHSLAFSGRYGTEIRKDEGIGGFTLRERASDRDGSNWNAELRQFSALKSGSIYETRFAVSSNHSNVVPYLDAVRVDVSDTFNSGGAQNRYEDDFRSYDFGNLYTRQGQKLTIKTGMEGSYRRQESYSLSNFGGTFTFPNLEAFESGVADTYREARGEPFQRATQLDMSGFVQNDIALTQQLSLMAGVRYDAQTNLSDYNNFSPRTAVAYGAGRGLVLRGGWGMFFERLPLNRVAEQRRYDGVQQYEIVIDKPTYPDPFSGAVRSAFPSIRVTDPNIVTPFTFVTMVSAEKTFWRTLLVTATYDYQDNHRRLVMRDLNQPRDMAVAAPTACTLDTLPGNCLRPDQGQGTVLNLTNVSFQRTHTVRLSMRHRFSIFNTTGNYVFQDRFEDNTDFGIPTNSYEPRADWSPGGMSRHQVNGSLNAQLPGGVFLSENLSAASGRFYTITTGNDDNQDGTKNDRPPGVGRNGATGPGRLTFDLNVSKAFFLGGAGSAGTRKNVNVFTNITNMFNRVNYGIPSSVLSSDNFGTFTSASDPREVEIGLRFQF